MKRISAVLFVTFCFLSAIAQTEDAYADFRRQLSGKYTDFRKNARRSYVDFVRQAWEWYGEPIVVPQPKEEMLPPVVLNDDPVVEDTPIIHEDLEMPMPPPQPLPLTPIREDDTTECVEVITTLYGADFKARFPKEKISVHDAATETLAKGWEIMSETFNNTVRDCLENRILYSLSDWAFLRMLDALCSQNFGYGTNEAELAKAYIFSTCGYQMRISVTDSKVVMLYASPFLLYDKPSWKIEGMNYYCDIPEIQEVYVCSGSLPDERPLLPIIIQPQRLPINMSKSRRIRGAGLDANSSVNINYISFCNDFPPSQYGDDPMTRWAIYAKAPTSNEMQLTLYLQLKQTIDGMTDYEAVDAICRWIQTGFDYEYDDNVWGHDRAFFADETLYYPYCDCEDRAILLTRIVRDLLGLDCALVYYPGHLAGAVALGEAVKGDYVRIAGKKFLICDPTYINAPIGMTMPGMDNQTAKTIVL